MDVIADIKRTVDALTLIITCPLWPKREDLPESGQRLFDSMVQKAKPYSKGIDVYHILEEWTELFNAFVDSEKIRGNEACLRMVEVYKHYHPLSRLEPLELEHINIKVG